MRLPRILPLYWEHLSRTTAKEFVLFGVLLVLWVVLALFEPYNTEHPSYGQAPERVTRDHLTLQQRLGYATLLRAGYGTAKLKTRNPSDPKPIQENYLEFEKENHPDLECLEFPTFNTPGGLKIDIRHLAIAIIAAEKYNRSPSQRSLKASFAERSLQFQGKLPEYSFGLAQIRPVTARRFLQQELGPKYELSDRDLLTLLMNDCQNVRLAGKYVEELCHQFASSISVDELIKQVALTYNGAVTPSIHGLRYVDAVIGAYYLLQRPDFESHIKSAENTVYVNFGIGAVTGEMDVNKLEAKAGKNKVNIYFVHRDPGPKAYVAQLAAQRRDWLIGKLEEIGYTRDRIAITELSSMVNMPESHRHLFDDVEGALGMSGAAVINITEGEAPPEKTPPEKTPLEKAPQEKTTPEKTLPEKTPPEKTLREKTPQEKAEAAADRAEAAADKAEAAVAKVEAILMSPRYGGKRKP